MFPYFLKQKMTKLSNFFNRNNKVSPEREGEINSRSQSELSNAYDGIDPDTKRYQEDPVEKVLRESGGQDISAI